MGLSCYFSTLGGIAQAVHHAGGCIYHLVHRGTKHGALRAHPRPLSRSLPELPKDPEPPHPQTCRSCSSHRPVDTFQRQRAASVFCARCPVMSVAKLCRSHDQAVALRTLGIASWNRQRTDGPGMDRKSCCLNGLARVQVTETDRNAPPRWHLKCPYCKLEKRPSSEGQYTSRRPIRRSR